MLKVSFGSHKKQENLFFSADNPALKNLPFRVTEGTNQTPTLDFAKKGKWKYFHQRALYLSLFLISIPLPFSIKLAISIMFRLCVYLAVRMTVRFTWNGKHNNL